MDHSGKCISMFYFYRYTISAITHGYKRIHKEPLVGLGLNYLIQKTVKSLVKVSLLAAYGLKCR